ncbi:juvenile hormone epoxide hydrolase 1 [Solenopsis invicta]|uniref:juvenile hormone epoxide hydrolase 1 n=1 Tax=Solenopsis invicta TaxID=13686 RepID=UPI0005959165|nr:juvenile hormone epoxide hydrolase 1 [Solenopsis invicta]
MGYILPTIITFMCSSALYAVVKYFSKSSSRKVQKFPKIPETFWKKYEEEGEEITDVIKPYNVTFSPEFVEDLKTRLKNTNKDNDKSDDLMQELLNYWANSYDFKKCEIYINKYPHFTTNIQGLDIHYIHVKPNIHSKGKKIFPLLMLHGWPSSIIEFYKIIPLLTCSKSEYNFIFEVIVPSLPGFGFSDAPMSHDDFSCIDMSVVLKNLMLRLGHNKFYVHGGDWGIFISRIMSTLFPEHVLGTHCNVCALKKFGKVPSYSNLIEITKQVISSKKFQTDTQYFQLQAIKPETNGVAFNDSPAALATYIIEKSLIATKYSKINRQFLEIYSYDDLINNLMIYWTSKSITTAMKVYAEQFTESNSELIKELLNLDGVNVPCDFSYYLSKVPRTSVLRRINKNFMDIIYSQENGRFPAIEEPRLFAEDIYFKINKMKTI